MFYQGLISSETECDAEDGMEYTTGLSSYQPVTDAMASGLLFSSIDR